jgi:EmrB/QacA subfamily drug resistance transporter
MALFTMKNVTEAKSSKNSIIFVSVCAAFLPPFMASSVTVALPTIGREFSMPAVTLSWIITSYFCAIAVFLIPFGKAGDLYGRRNIFLYGILTYTMASLFAGFAPGAATLIIARILQGFGASMIFSAGLAMLTSAVLPRERGAMLGLNVASTYIGLSLGPTVGGIMTQTLGWRSIFFANVPLGLVIIGFVVWKIRQEKTENPAPQHSFDTGGSLVYGGSLIALMYGLSKLPHSAGIVCCAAGAAGLGLFAWIESRIASPVLAINLFRHNRVFVLSNLAALLSYSATNGAGFFLSLYLQYVKGLPPRDAGLVMMAQPLVMAIFSPFAGKLSDRIEPRIVASAGMTMTAAGLFLFSRITATTSFYYIIAGLLLLGIGVAFFSSPNTSAIMGSAEKAQYGMASSIVGTMRLAGSILSMNIAAMLLAAFIGNVPVTAARNPLFIASARTSFVVFGIFCTLGIFASLSRGNVRKRTREAQPGQNVLIE